jgi:3-oxoacyl-[acyl-carrier-protein] synthase-3
MKGKILSCGGYLPKTKLTNDDLVKIKNVDTSDEWIYTRTGIRQRFILEDGLKVTDMALEASLIALDGIEGIDGIIFATSTQDLAFPSSACILQRKLREAGKNVNGFAFDVIAACAGFVHAVVIANSMIKSGLAKKILVIGADIVSKILNWEERETCVLFGDGAGAIVIEAVPESDVSGIIDGKLMADGDLGSILKTNGGIVDRDEKLHIEMKGKEVFVHAVKKMSESIEELISKNNITKQDVDLVIAHQANVRILEAVAKTLEMPLEKFVVTIDRHANTSAASIPLALWETLKEDKIKRGDTIIFEALGGGLVWGGVLLKW